MYIIFNIITLYTVNKHYKILQMKFTKIQFVNLKGEFCPLKTLSGKKEFGRLQVSHMLILKEVFTKSKMGD